jgi:hypothetical protein
MATKTTPKRKHTKRHRTLKQLAEKVVRKAEAQAQKLVRDVRQLRTKRKPRVEAPAQKKPARPRRRASRARTARSGARARA